jgi:hypothetical protein
MDLIIEEHGELSGKFQSTFNIEGKEYLLEIDINEMHSVPFMMGKNWMQFHVPYQMNLYIGEQYRDIPIEYGRKIYKIMTLNGWVK